MKAIVLEIKDGVAAVLKEDGTVATTTQKCAVGDTICLEEKRGILPMRGMHYAAAAAAVLILAGVGGGTYLTASACSYVSLDVNPSLEFTLNRLNRVIGVTAVNEDAEKLAEALRADAVKNDTLPQALGKSVDFLTEEGYLDGEEDYILLNVTSDDSKRSAKLEDEAVRVLDGRFGSEGETRWIISFSDRQTRGYARELGISAGRYEEIRTIEEAKEAAANDSTDKEPETFSRMSREGEIKRKTAGYLDVETVGKYKDDSLEELFVKSGRIPEGSDPAGSASGNGVQPGDGSGNPGSGGWSQDGSGQDGVPQGGASQSGGTPEGSNQNPGNGGWQQDGNRQGDGGQSGVPQGGNGDPAGGNGAPEGGNSQGGIPGNGVQPGDGNGNPGNGVQPGDGNGNPGSGVQPGDGNGNPGSGVQPGDGNRQDSSGQSGAPQGGNGDPAGGNGTPEGSNPQGGIPGNSVQSGDGSGDLQDGGQLTGGSL